MIGRYWGEYTEYAIPASTSYPFSVCVRPRVDTESVGSDCMSLRKMPVIGCLKAGKKTDEPFGAREPTTSRHYGCCRRFRAKAQRRKSGLFADQTRGRMRAARASARG